MKRELTLILVLSIIVMLIVIPTNSLAVSSDLDFSIADVRAGFPAVGTNSFVDSINQGYRVHATEQCSWTTLNGKQALSLNSGWGSIWYDSSIADSYTLEANAGFGQTGNGGAVFVRNNIDFGLVGAPNYFDFNGGKGYGAVYFAFTGTTAENKAISVQNNSVVARICGTDGSYSDFTVSLPAGCDKSNCFIQVEDTGSYIKLFVNGTLTVTVDTTAKTVNGATYTQNINSNGKAGFGENSTVVNIANISVYSGGVKTVKPTFTLGYYKDNSEIKNLIYGNIDAKAEINNPLGNGAITAAAVTALFYGSKLISASISLPITVNGGETGSATVQIVVPQNIPDNSRLTTFLWRSATNMKPLCSSYSIAKTNVPDNTIFYNSPGTDFGTALPIGNGFLGGMVYGGVLNDKISLNESTIWTGSPYENNKEGAFAQLASLRAQSFNNQNIDSAWNSAFVSGYDGQIYQLAGDLNLDYADKSVYTEYSRWIDLDEGISKAIYKRGDTTYTREYLANYPSNCIASQIVSNGTPITLTGSFSSKMSGTSSTFGNDTLVFDGVGNSAKGISTGIRFRVATKFIPTGGSVSANGSSVTVTGATSIIVVTCIKTNFIAYNDISGNEKIALNMVNTASAKGYSALKSEHIADYKNLYGRANLSLDKSYTEASKPTDIRLNSFSTTNDPGFAELVYNYDRYLLISSSGEGGQPANLQGIWNDQLSPPWDSKYTININTEMNYWGAYQTNVPEVVDPLVQKLKNLQITGAVTARELYGITRPGAWVVHHNTDLWNINGPVDGPWGMTPTCGAWLSNEIYDDYLFTMDNSYLEEIYPIIKGSAEFFADFLVPYTYNGKEYLVTCPSTSPERQNGPLGYVTYGSAFDNQIIRALFQNVISAAKTLGTDAALVTELETKLQKLPDPVTIGSWGQIREFLFHDYDFSTDAHRHISMLYGAYPGKTINKDVNLAWGDAVNLSLDKRTAPGDWTGWGLAWRINQYARLGNGDKAYQMIKIMLTSSNNLRMPNLLGAHPMGGGSMVFQFDCNGGTISGMTEMFVSSPYGEVNLLGALPTEWQNGSIQGVRARGGFIVNELTWNNGTFTKAKITSEKGGILKVRYGSMTRSLETTPGGVYEFDSNLQQNGEGIPSQDLTKIFIGNKSDIQTTPMEIGKEATLKMYVERGNRFFFSEDGETFSNEIVMGDAVIFSDNKITAVQQGTSVIKITSTSNPALYDTVTVTVKALVPVPIQVINGVTYSVYEFEKSQYGPNSVDSGGVMRPNIDNSTGASGGQALGWWQPNCWATFNIYSENAGTAKMIVSYCSADGDGYYSIKVNDITPFLLKFLRTASANWNDYQKSEIINVTLNKGLNKITFYGSAQGANLNGDAVYISAAQ